MRPLPLARLLCAALSTLSAAPALASGCGLPRAAGPTEIIVRSDGRSRAMLVHVPAGYDPARATPLVFNLHGSGSRGREQLASSGLAATADAHGFLVAAPDGGIPLGQGFVWNIPGVPSVSGALPTPQDADDTRFIADAIDAVAAQLCVDPRRVYATGLSGGGRMSSWLGCALPRRIAAIAPVVGLRAGIADQKDFTMVDRTTCTPSRPVPVMAFAGLKDRTNPIAGGEGLRWGYSMHAAEQRWAEINRCTAMPTTRWIDHDTYEEGYETCAGGSVVLVRVDVAGEHNWLVADNDAMWRFFAAHPLPQR